MTTRVPGSSAGGSVIGSGYPAYLTESFRTVVFTLPWMSAPLTVMVAVPVTLAASVRTAR